MEKYNWTVTQIDEMPVWTTLELVIQEHKEAEKRNSLPKKGYIDEFLGI